MEIDSNNVAETEKYAFLLGSAIKNEDTDQFFSIYDSILPKDLPDSQLELIKDKARTIAELPEQEFNNLVFKARSFSLAPAGTTMSCSESPSKKWVQPRAAGGGAGGDSDDEDEGVSSSRLSSLPGGKSDTSSLYSSNTAKISHRSFESDTQRFDEDSGVCNSSKATNSIGSWSDQEASDYEGHRHFDYYPQVKIRSGAGLNLDYDEAHEVKSDQSSQDVNSPRSDISDGREMETYSLRYNPRLDDDDEDDEFQFHSSSYRRPAQDQDDFNTDGESDDEKNRRMYEKRGYTKLYKESEYSSGYSFKTYDLPSSGLRTRDVDNSINFSYLKDGTSPYSRHLSCTAGSEKVKIEKNSYKKDQPPFGHGREQLHKVGNSVDKLISHVPEDGDVKNMPEARKLQPLLSSEDVNKKKNKKKKKNSGSKDDAATDENGNPIDRFDVKSSYRQMREPPPGVGGTAGSNQQTTAYGTLDTTSSVPNLSKDPEEDGKKQLRKKKKQKEQPKFAQDVDNYVGDKLTIDELVQLIDGENAANKKSKKLSPNVTNDIPGKPAKPIKKSKDKKQKSPTPSSSIEEVEAKGDEPVQKTVSDTQVSSDNMGNLSAKTDVNIPVENGDIDGIYCTKDKLKPLLNEDRRDSKSSVAGDCNLSENKPTFCKESVKEKTVAKTNIKRETVGEAVSDKKKSEKLKNLRVEKTEMSVSKSEETIRVEPLIVKQKNAKNKKPKPMSPTVTVNNDVINQSPPVINSISDDNLIGDNNFIFTDLDVPQVPKEDEFQVVGKKKKKPVKESVPLQNNFLGNNNKPHRRFDDKRTTPTNNINKSPAPSTIHSSPIESDPHARDLSPSAFPALVSGKGRQSLQDGRRNSTGDVPIPLESLLKSQDDSDMESVKSLPATQGHAQDNMLSPRLNVSYAKMAASKQSSSSGERSSLDSGDQSDEYELKKAMWKGSPTERRHSIGSSPDGVNKSNKNSSVAAVSSVSSTLKAGSQENIIVGEIPVASRLESTVQPKSTWAGISPKDVGKADELSASIGVEFGGGNMDLDKLSTMPVQTVQPSLSEVTKSTCLTDFPTLSSSNAKQAVSDKPIKSSSVEVQTPKATSCSSNSGSHSKSIPPSSNVHKQETQKGKIISVNNKKQKSVIFLDKPFEETPGSLGISFGFEFEPIVNKPRTEAAVVNEQATSEVGSPVSEGAEVSSSDDKAKDNAGVTNSIPEINDVKSDDEPVTNKSSSPSVIDNTIDSDSPSSSKSDTTPEPPTGKAIVSQITRLNGVVSSAPRGQTVNVIKDNNYIDNAVNEVAESPVNVVSVTPQQAEQTINKKVVVAAQANEVIVYYGEGVATLKKDVIGPSLTNGPTRYCGVVTFVEETELKSNFSFAEAASFLTKEWDRVRQLQDREPDNVKVHQS